MNYELATGFKEKQTILQSYGGSLADVLLLLKRIEDLQPDALVTRGSELKIMNYSPGRFLVSWQNTEFLCELSGEGETASLRLLDIAQYVEMPQFSHVLPQKDPRMRDEINPHNNLEINPLLNTDLNPHVNVDLNPCVNTDLNPKVNSDLNPMCNYSINYRHDPALHPRSNDLLNPNINKFINPKLNRLFDGLFVFDLNNDQIEFTVKANEQVTLYFDDEMEFIAMGVHNQSGGETLFDLEFDWTGFTVPDGQGGYLRFDLEAEWNGYLV
ncbi:hypothetical protein HQ585_07770 [candidate division KSB1 bacterium]|nr:hypothetical protein [candidate division KSB1 bacterium]